MRECHCRCHRSRFAAAAQQPAVWQPAQPACPSASLPGAPALPGSAMTRRMTCCRAGWHCRKCGTGPPVAPAAVQAVFMYDTGHLVQVVLLLHSRPLGLRRMQRRPAPPACTTSGRRSRRLCLPDRLPLTAMRAGASGWAAPRHRTTSQLRRLTWPPGVQEHPQAGRLCSVASSSSSRSTSSSRLALGTRLTCSSSTQQECSHTRQHTGSSSRACRCRGARRSDAALQPVAYPRCGVVKQ